MPTSSGLRGNEDGVRDAEVQHREVSVRRDCRIPVIGIGNGQEPVWNAARRDGVFP
jgi:hypothetical protein